MSTDQWKNIKQDIELMRKKLEGDRVYPLADLIDMHKEIVFLRNLMYDALSDIDSEAIVQTSLELANVTGELRRHIVKQTRENKEHVREWLLEEWKNCDRETTQLVTHIETSASLIAARFQGYANDLSFFKRLSSIVEKDQDPSCLFDILSEIFYILNTESLRNLFKEDKLLSQRMTQLRKDALARKIKTFEKQVSSFDINEEHAERSSDLLIWGANIRSNISRNTAEHQPLLEICQKNRNLVREKTEKYLQNCSARFRQKFICELAIDINDQANDILSQTEENSLPLAIKQLMSMKEETDWLCPILKKVSKEKDAPKDVRKRYKKLRKIDKYLAAELQEKKLQERLEGIFGRKFVAFFENLILFLIFLVIVLLMVEMSHPGMSEQTHRTFLWIDAGICVIFLLEFFTKLFLSEGKLFYFWRHWFIDFLPSIPFGLVLLHAHTLQAIDYSRSVRAARFIRISRMSRLIRYIRILRPIIRIFRVLSFLLRGTDRLVRRYSRWLNRNIIFFGSQDEISEKREPSLRQKFQDLYSKSLARSRTIYRNARSEKIRPYMHSYLVSLDVRVQKSELNIVEQEQDSLSKDILAEDVLFHLLSLQGTKVEELMGTEFCQQVHRYVGFLNAPLVRHFPMIRKFIKKQQKLSAVEFTAWMGRSLGRYCEKLLAMIYWVVDLYGIVTGPRLVDRLGNTLVTSFKRPAKRLLMIGSIFLIFNILAQALPFPFLKHASASLEHYVGTPVIILGCICLIPLMLGFWLRQIAGEATGFYERTVEAQFINLLKDLKLRNSQKDLELLYKRVLLPETTLISNKESDGKNTIQQMRSELTDWAKDPEECSTHLTTRQEAKRWKLSHGVMLLYKDYLDGAPLHHSDVKTTEQLLGNITIRNVLEHRLRYTRKDFKELDKLDLTRSRSVMGPYLWFSLITQSIAQNTAQLIVEYNTHSVRDSMLDVQGQDTVRIYRNWLEKKENKKEQQAQPEQKELSKEEKKEQKKKLKRRSKIMPLYATTQFTALHFLGLDRAQDEVIRLDFEEKLYQTFIKDRKKAIREVFSSYPLCNLPKSQRTLNLYFLYAEYMAGGRIFTLPFKMFGLSLHGIKLSVSWIYYKIKEIVAPALYRQEKIEPEINFDVVVRKINRMRKPVYIQCMKARAHFDFEYLGLNLPGMAGLPMHSSLVLQARVTADRSSYYTFEHDLDFIRALDSERDFFYQLRSKRQNELHNFDKFMNKHGWDNEGFDQLLKSKGMAKRHAEIKRAMAIAYTTNYCNMASLITARKDLDQMIDQTIQNKGKLFRFPWYKRMFLGSYRFICHFILRMEDWEKKSFYEFWEHTRENAPKKQKRWCWRSYLANRSKLKNNLRFIDDEGSIKMVDQIVEKIIGHPGSWTEELIAVRTIQTLAVLDVQNYRRHLSELGDYSEKQFYSN